MKKFCQRISVSTSVIICTGQNVNQSFQPVIVLQVPSTVQGCREPQRSNAEAFDAGKLTSTSRNTSSSHGAINAGRTPRGDCPSKRPMHRTASDSLPTEILAAESDDNDKDCVLDQCAAVLEQDLVTVDLVSRASGVNKSDVFCKAMLAAEQPVCRSK